MSEYMDSVHVVRAATALGPGVTEYTDPVDCLNALQINFFLDGTLAYPVPGLLCTLATNTSLVDQSAAGSFVPGMAGMTVTGSGIDTGTTVSSVTNAHTIVLNKATLATAIDVADIAFAFTSIGLASMNAQFRRDPATSLWHDRSDASTGIWGADGTSGLTDGSCVSIIGPVVNGMYVPWSQARLKVVGHATKLTPALRVKATVVTSGATPTSGGSIAQSVAV